MHQYVVQDLSALCPNQDDVLRDVVRELGSPKTNENDMLHGGPTEITLTLNPKFHEIDGM
jgi:Ras GTPase-activating-like protein IQGAP2/3